MTLRIPIPYSPLGQDIRASFAPMGPVDAVQVADPRGRALQGLGDALGQVGDTISKVDAARSQATKAQAARSQAIDAEGKTIRDSLNATLDDYDNNPIDYSPGSDPTRFKYQQDSRAWAMQTYAQCVSQAADLGTQLTSQGQDGADAPAGNLFDALRMPTLQQAFGGALPAFGTASRSGAPASSLTASSSASGSSPTPSPTDIATHGLTGAWVNGYDLIAQRGVSAANDPAVAQRIAEQCRLDRANGRLNILSYEALRNVQQREDGYLASVQTVADKRLTADPAALGEMLAFAKANMIRVDPHRQAGFEAKVDNILIDAAMQTAIRRDPRGLVLALEHRAGFKDAQGSNTAGDAKSVVPTPEDHLAEHPVTSALSPEQAQAWLPRANAALETARSTARVATLQASDTALREYRDAGSAAHAPDEAQLIGTLGLEHGQQVSAQLQEARSEGNHYVNLRSLPSAALRDMQAQEGEGGAVQDTVQSAVLSTPASPSQRAIDRILRERQNDPIGAALSSGNYGAQALPFTPAAIEDGSLATTLRGRALAAKEIANDYQTAPALLSRDETRALAQTLRAASPAQQQALLKHLVESVGNDDLTQSALQALSGEEPVLALAGWHMGNEVQGEELDSAAGAWGGSGKRSAPAMLIEGHHLTQPAADGSGKGGLPMPADRDSRPVFDRLAGTGDPGLRTMQFEGAKACYACMSAHEGDHSGKLDERRMGEAVFYAVRGSATPGDAGRFLTSSARAHVEGQSMDGQSIDDPLDPSEQSTARNPFGLSQLQLKKAETYLRDLRDHGDVQEVELTPRMRRHIQFRTEEILRRADELKTVPTMKALEASGIVGEPSGTLWTRAIDSLEAERSVRKQEPQFAFGSDNKNTNAESETVDPLDPSMQSTQRNPFGLSELQLGKAEAYVRDLRGHGDVKNEELTPRMRQHIQSRTKEILERVEELKNVPSAEEWEQTNNKSLPPETPWSRAVRSLDAERIPLKNGLAIEGAQPLQGSGVVRGENGADIQDDAFQKNRTAAIRYIETSKKMLTDTQKSYLNQRLSVEMQGRSLNEEEVKQLVDKVAEQKSWISSDQLKKIFPNVPADKLSIYAYLFNTYMPQYGVDTPEKQAAFLGQVGQETGGLVNLREGMYHTDPERLARIYRGIFPNKESALPYLRNPTALANRVYGDQNGNKGVESGDGDRYRGGGILQITGRKNYDDAGKAIGTNLIDHPELLWTDLDTSVRAAMKLWSDRGINEHAQVHSEKNLAKVTRLVNGAGMEGHAERVAITRTALQVLAPQKQDSQQSKEQGK